MHLAVHLDVVELTAFGDVLVKRQVITVDELQSYARAWTHHGYRRGREAAGLVRERVDSVPESHLRLLLVLAGLPEPVVNHWVRSDDGEPIYRLDLAYPEILLAIEYDGRWHDEPGQRARDELRRTWLRRRGWLIIVVRAEGLYRKCDETLVQIVDALTDLGLALPPRSEEYRRYFGQVLSA
ncbi:MAG: endonuclease domain-containing protein [Dermatophilaceae bacterium]|nr:DUF559 domain-containing protein [Intrasporangiaceae bacterium]